jgi:hypothetical protein
MHVSKDQTLSSAETPNPAMNVFASSAIAVKQLLLGV